MGGSKEEAIGGKSIPLRQLNRRYVLRRLASSLSLLTPPVQPLYHPPRCSTLSFASRRGDWASPRRYFNFTNSKTKIAHTPTVIGNSTNDASLSEPPRGSAYVRSIMARAVRTPTANLPFQFIPVRPRFPVWPSRFRKRQRFYTFVPLHGEDFRSNEPYRRSEHLTPLSILPGAPSPPSCNVPS